MPVVVKVVGPDHLLLDKGAKKVEFDVNVMLVNTGDTDHIVTVSNTNDVMFWHLLDPDQKEVQRMPSIGKPTASKDGSPVKDKRVPGGERVAFPELVELDASKLKPGKTYILRVRAWGMSGEHPIHVCDTAAPPQAAKDPAPGKPEQKKGARKTAAKKPAAKKPAAKKTKKAA
jgi:hypothetical protein